MSWTLKDFDRYVEKLELDPIDHKKSKFTFSFVSITEQAGLDKSMMRCLFIL